MSNALDNFSLRGAVHIQKFSYFNKIGRIESYLTPITRHLIPDEKEESKVDHALPDETRSDEETSNRWTLHHGRRRHSNLSRTENNGKIWTLRSSVKRIFRPKREIHT